ncbi:MAG: copper homeostasis protein CutC [Prevotellaceae bacterium]|nr:copper homeostasis protein CutC [Prevotellaceae bacterium]
MSTNYILEVCAGLLQSVLEAEKGGANRVELCAALYEGGTTPSAATVELACKMASIPVYVIIRPRGGDFLYSDLEFEIMKRDILYAKAAGAKGIVTGLLKANSTVDIERTSILVEMAYPMDVTFHRAFDMVKNPLDALEDIIKVGCRRILTSGGHNKAFDGKQNIAALARWAAGRISIMAGSGVNAGNVKQLIGETGISEVHTSGKARLASGMQFKNMAIAMGGIPQIPEYDIDITDAGAIRDIRKILDSL